MDIKFDGTVTLGNLIAALAFLFAGLGAWIDLRWRIKNIESWRTQHTEDAAQRDILIRKLDLANERLEVLISSRVVGGRRTMDKLR